MEIANERDHALLGTVLVTGGCGFIGSFITEAFAAEPSCTRLVVASRTPNNFCLPEVEYRSCDFTKSEQVKALLDDIQPRTIIHTVSRARSHYRQSITKSRTSAPNIS
jgi:sterol-4alpha-carboxylate 3-dehydrogenase (decarboxylating)